MASIDDAQDTITNSKQPGMFSKQDNWFDIQRLWRKQLQLNRIIQRFGSPWTRWTCCLLRNTIGSFGESKQTYEARKALYEACSISHEPLMRLPKHGEHVDIDRPTSIHIILPLCPKQGQLSQIIKRRDGRPPVRMWSSSPDRCWGVMMLESRSCDSEG